MRYISPNIEAVFAADHYQTFYLIAITGNSVDLKYTTYFEDLDVPSIGGTFLAKSNLAEFKPPVLENAANREFYKLTFVDADFQLRAVAESNIIGARVRVYMVATNPFEYPLGNAETGQPLLDEADITLGFEGTLDTKEYAITPMEQIAVFTIECSTPMTSLGLVKSLLTSKDSVQQFDATDTCYDLSYEGSPAVNLLWGKA